MAGRVTHDEPVATEVEELRGRGAGATTLDPPPYVVVFTDTAARLVPLPRDGSVQIGRAPDVELQLDQPKVSRYHAVIMVRAGRATVRDLSSNNGTTVDGVQIAGEVALRPGAVIGVSGVQLVFHGGVGAPRTVCNLATLCERIDDEIERSTMQERPFAVVALRGDAPADEIVAAATGELRSFDRVAALDREVLILLPELDAGEASELAARLAATTAVTAGVAVWPRDGDDAGALVAAARAAADDAPHGQIAPAHVRVRTIELSGREVLIADPVMARVYDLIERVAIADLPVLVCGATGTGKELAAAAVHHFSRRRAGPFVAVNCAALNANLVERELFGHQRGAFSGADNDQAGLIEAAHGGTLFFDEVAELPPAIQAKLLRVVETHTFYRVGANAERGVDVRIVAATNRDLAAEVAADRFRTDLYYRLSTATIWLPPLADRRSEIAVLAEAFLAAARKAGERATFSDEALRRLVEHAWPGNVRQLRNCVEFLAATVTGRTIDAGGVESYLQPRPGETGPPSAPSLPTALRPIKQEIRELEQRRMVEALEIARGNQTLAAALIEMPLRTFVAKLRQYRIDPRAARG